MDSFLISWSSDENSRFEYSSKQSIKVMKIEHEIEFVSDRQLLSAPVFFSIFVNFIDAGISLNFILILDMQWRRNKYCPKINYAIDPY